MRSPERLEPLIELGVIDEVVRPLLAGKEAAVYLVRAAGELRVAKVYKDAENRSFRQRAEYTEGRKTRNSREERALKRKSAYGKEMLEAAWRSAEVDAIYRLRAAGVRVPEPYDFVEGVLVMELVKGPDGGPAPRLVDCHFTPEQAEELHDLLIRETV
ncbi:MAG: RIO1 family regulatory kinase/ATPase, partial [bacterium]